MHNVDNMDTVDNVDNVDYVDNGYVHTQTTPNGNNSDSFLL